MSGAAVANIVDDSFQYGVDFPSLSNATSERYSPSVPQKTRATRRTVSSRTKESKEIIVEEAKAILEGFICRHERHSTSSTSDDDTEFEPIEAEFELILNRHSSELDFYNDRKGKICRTKKERLRSEQVREFCKVYTQPSEVEIRKSRRTKHVPFDLCKKEIRRGSNQKENAERKKENIEEELKGKHIKRKWPNGMPKVERPIKQEEKIVNKCPRKKPRRTAVINFTGPLHVYNNSDFILRSDNGDKFGEEELMNFLIGLQDHDISPEDFDLLLQLDNFVQPKTLPKAAIDALETDTVNASSGDVCTVCMEEYSVGDVRKYLPCGHFFHSSCIRIWLSTTSFKCPIDGQEIS